MAKKFKDVTKDLKEKSEAAKKRYKGLSVWRKIALFIMTAATVCAFVLYDYIFGSKTVFIGKGYKPDILNAVMEFIPKLIKSLQITTIVLLITTVILKIIVGIWSKNQREITVAKLICNLVKCVVCIGLVITVLAVFGIDTTALITGAGVITLVVGLGMQSLIADVVAGLFIVFDNEFNVGDIITVDDFRGEVVSIGIRTTKLKALGNIKIFNNSDIRKVLNQTIEPSTAFAYVDIEYGAQLEKIDEIIKRELPKLCVQGAITEVCYDGVSKLGESGVTLQFSCQCKESDIFAVQREMNKQIKNMFDANGINIPFNQLVVHIDGKE